MKRKILNSLAAITLIAPCAFAFSACGLMPNNASFEAAQNASATTETIIEDLTSNYYNASSLGKSTKYSVAQLKEKDSDFVYYIDLGIMTNIENVDSITLGNTTFDDEQTFDLSIGNANFISDKAFYQEDNKLFVAAPILAFETVNNSKIKINNNEFDLTFDKTAESKNFTSAEFSTGSTNTVEKNNDNSFNINFKDAKSYLKLYYDGATANDIVLTKKVFKNTGDNNLNNKPNYGLTKVENLTNNPLGLYPIGYSVDALTETWSTKYNGATMNYEAYIKEKGILAATLNFEIILDSAE